VSSLSLLGVISIFGNEVPINGNPPDKIASCIIASRFSLELHLSRLIAFARCVGIIIEIMPCLAIDSDCMFTSSAIFGESSSDINQILHVQALRACPCRTVVVDHAHLNCSDSYISRIVRNKGDFYLLNLESSKQDGEFVELVRILKFVDTLVVKGARAVQTSKCYVCYDNRESAFLNKIRLLCSSRMVIFPFLSQLSELYG